MILYIETSALIKEYIHEVQSKEVKTLVDQTDLLGTSSITRPEVVATFAKSLRMGALWPNVANNALDLFRKHWIDLLHIPVTEDVGARADIVAWGYGLRGFDAVHLASALIWQESLREQITFATFDKQLWNAGKQSGLIVWPAKLE